MTLQCSNTVINHYLIVLMFICLQINTLNGQSTIESLLQSIVQMNEDSVLADSLIELAYLYSRKDNAKVAYYGNKALNISIKISYKKGIGDANMRLGMYEKAEGEFEKAIDHYNAALKIRSDYADKPGMASVYNNIGLCQFSMGNPELAIENIEKGIQITSSYPPSKIKAILYNSLADIYVFTEKYKEAIPYLDSCYNSHQYLDDKSAMARLLLTKGHLNFELKNYAAAKESFYTSLEYFTNIPDERGMASVYLALGNLFFEQKEIDESLNYFNKSLYLKNTLPEFDLGSLYYNLGRTYRIKNKIVESKDYLLKSQNLLLNQEQYWALADVYLEVGNINFDQRDFFSAKEYFLKSLKYSDADYDPYAKANTYYNLSECYTQLSKIDSALHFSQLHNALRDSIYNNRVEAINHQLNLKEIQKKNTELNLKLSESKRRNLWFYGIIALSLLAVLLLVIALLYNTSKQKRKNAEYQLYLAEEEVQQANRKVDDLLQSQELKMAYAKLKAKDETQKKIGEDLHDRIGVMLSTIKLYFTEFTEQLNTLAVDTSKKQFKAVELLDEAVQEVRRISHDMQSGVLQKLGLIEALKSMANSIQDSGQLEVEVKIHGFKEKLSNAVEVKIYKIIQEAVANVLKHAKANKITIYLYKQDELINIIVEDDGIGFKMDEVEKKDGMGLKNIAYRVAELNGTCHFDSKNKRGTSVVIDIPLPKTEIF